MQTMSRARSKKGRFDGSDSVDEYCFVLYALDGIVVAGDRIG